MSNFIAFQKNAAGVDITLTIKSAESLLGIDISAAIVHNFIFERPDGTWFIRAATFATNGIDGKLTYTTTVDDLDQVGHWNLQVDLGTPNAYVGRTQWLEFNVLRNIGQQN